MRTIHSLSKKVMLINKKELEYQKLSEEEFLKNTDIFKERLKSGKESLNDIIIEALATVKNGCRRLAQKKITYSRGNTDLVWDMIPYDVQLIGAMVLLEGKISEMKTGEGKTLVAALALYVSALEGKGAHLVTVNEYLASRDASEMGILFNYLGLTIGVIKHGQDHQDKKEAYSCDITYGTNNEFGFDYLRDNMATRPENLVQRNLHFAIVDEVDSILIDEARTPLIISSAAEESTEKYIQYSKLISKLKEKEHYTVDEKQRSSVLTEKGIAEMENLLGISNIYTEMGFTEVHHIEQALKAQFLFKCDKDYVVKDNKVVIVDEFTGRLMDGRRYSDGLHQAIEAKEGVTVQRESKTLATITFQNFFRLYKKLSGMTGTAVTEAEEFGVIYGLDTIIIPTNRPMVRIDRSDVIYKSAKGKFEAITNHVKELHKKGQPVLVGTVSVEKSEILSSYFERAGIPHTVLNAKYHEREAEIVARAGQKGGVTIATNMAGRGTDIKLGEGVKDLGGLFILGSERHESRRIDNQLRGRSGRQGDPGESQFYISMDDDLMRIFGSDRMKSIMNAMGMPEDMPIENSVITNSIEGAQKKVEQHHFDIRKHVVQYDDVMNNHRSIIYNRRREILFADNISERIKEELKKNIKNIIINSTEGIPIHEWDYEGMYSNIRLLCDDGIFSFEDWYKNGYKSNDLVSIAEEFLFKKYEEKKSYFPDLAIFNHTEKIVYLQTIDMLWMEHINNMQRLREATSLAGYGQRDPLFEYKHQAFEEFKKLLENISQNTISTLFRVRIEINDKPLEQKNVIKMKTNEDQIEGNISSNQINGDINSMKKAQALDALDDSESQEFARLFQSFNKQEEVHPNKITKIKADDDIFSGDLKIGRNDLCTCGSGKKYKKCCGIGS